MSVQAWGPLQAVERDSSLIDILNCCGVAGDGAAYKFIGQTLKERNCETVGTLFEDGGWTKAQWGALFRGAKPLSKSRHAYLAALEKVCGRKLMVDSCIKSESGEKEQGQIGGDTSLNCRKEPVSADFNCSTWVPDGFVYAQVNTTNKYLSDEDEKLYLDLLWLAVQADEEPTAAFGDYLPSATLTKLVNVHRRLKLPEFPPLRMGKPGERHRKERDVIYNKFFNGPLMQKHLILKCW